MPVASGKIDLGRLAIEHGGGRRLELELEPSEIQLGGQVYAADPPRVPALLEVSRTSRGWALHLRFSATIVGPCVRCLEPASFAIDVDAREVDENEATDEELISPYVDGFEVDVGRWADDALVLELPKQPLCREDCKGLCAVCGAPLNDADPADHEHGGRRDPRWAKLDQLRDD
jgi:uncharacterized protein